MSQSSDHGARRGSLLWGELWAGLTVSLVSLPQCLAYAMMSGLPPSYGLITAAIPGLVAALVGHSAQLVTGPTNTTGLLILGVLTPYLAAGGLIGPEGLPTLAALTLLVGLLRLGLAGVGGATLLRFIPESVLVGFTAGAGVLIALMQLDEALGLEASRATGALDQLAHVWRGVMAGQTRALPTALTLLMVAALSLGQRRRPRAPVALALIVGVTALSALLEPDPAWGLALVRDRGQVTSGWPPWAWPSLDPSQWRPLMLPACAIVLLGTLELTVSVRAQEGSPRMARELLAQGLANVAGSLCGAFPASASLTRSALLRLSGAQTRLAAVIAALSLWPIVWGAGSLVGSIPLAGLASVLWVTAWSVIRVDRVRRVMRASPEASALLGLTFLATLLLPLEWAILLGVGAGLALHLLQSARQTITLWAPLHSPRPWPLQASKDDSDDASDEDDALWSDEALTWTRWTPAQPAPQTLLIVEVSGDLHFAAAQQLRESLLPMLPAAPALIIMDLSHAHHMRVTAVVTLEQLDAQLRARGQALRLCGVRPGFARVLRESRSSLAWQEGVAGPTLAARVLAHDVLASRQDATRQDASRLVSHEATQGATP